MSVTFSIRGEEIDWDGPMDRWLNVNNTNAREILGRLGIKSDELCGELRAPELHELCDYALTSIEALEDTGRDAEEGVGAKGARWVSGARPAGRINQHIKTLQGIAKAAGDLGVISWG